MNKLKHILALVQPVALEKDTSKLPKSFQEKETEAYWNGVEYGRAELAEEILEILNGESK